MFKLILKNLWNRRGRYAWLFIELVIVTCLSWFIVDRVTVSLADSNIPLGYDADRLVLMAVGSFPEDNPNFKAAANDSASQAADFRRLADKLRAIPGVERVTFVNDGQELNANGISLSDYTTGNPADTLLHNISNLSFWPGYEYFETMGIKSVPGSPTVEELSARSYTRNELVITEDCARLFWPDGDAVGKHFVNIWDGDTTYLEVVGVVGNFRNQSFVRSNCAVYRVWRPLTFPKWDFYTVVRLEDGVSPENFATDFTLNHTKDIVTGNYYIKTVWPYESRIAEVESQFGIPTERNLYFILASFFLINLVLGIVGSFYLQTRRRVEEMGVHRSFGARRQHIMLMLMGEGAVLATVSAIVGFVIYSQITLRFGMSIGHSNNQMYNIIDTWVSHPVEHFFVISAIVYALILVCTLIGTYLPAREVSRVDPVDALRDE